MAKYNVVEVCVVGNGFIIIPRVGLESPYKAGRILGDRPGTIRIERTQYHNKLGQIIKDLLVDKKEVTS